MSRFAYLFTIALLFPVGCKSTQNQDASSLRASDVELKGSMVVVGLVPNRYFSTNHRSLHKGTALARIVIVDGIITELEKINDVAEAESFAQSRDLKLIVARGNSTGEFDIIYPGLVNFHNHNKQNFLGVWHQANSRFANRFEWREDWPEYKEYGAENWNPWSGSADAECATQRWTEVLGITLGTTYNQAFQGIRKCSEKWGNYSFGEIADVSEPTDLIVGPDMAFVWNKVRPFVKRGMKFPEALIEAVKVYCPAFVTNNNWTDGISSEIAEKLTKKTGKDELIASCSTRPEDQGTVKDLVDYLSGPHGSRPLQPNIAGRLRSMRAGENTDRVLIPHLAEGRRDDPINRTEFELLRVFGFDQQKHMVLIHGVGLNASGYPEAGITENEYEYVARKKWGITWSPFSNLLLYGQTLDVKAAIKAGVLLTLGSDWTPTGTKSVLEELKIARDYALSGPEGDLSQHFRGPDNVELDEFLFNMVTENSAILLNQFGPGGFGSLRPGFRGTLIAVRKTDANPYTSLVANADQRHVNLVVIAGKPLYGEIDYLTQYGIHANQMEVLPKYFEENIALRPGSAPDFANWTGVNRCVDEGDQPIRKGFVNQIQTKDPTEFPVYDDNVIAAILKKRIQTDQAGIANEIANLALEKTDDEIREIIMGTELVGREIPPNSPNIRQFVGFSASEIAKVRESIFSTAPEMFPPSTGPTDEMTATDLADILVRFRATNREKFSQTVRSMNRELISIFTGLMDAPRMASILGLRAGSLGLNLDRVLDIQKYLAFRMMTSSTNAIDGDNRYRATHLPPLYSCNDNADLVTQVPGSPPGYRGYSDYIENFISQTVPANIAGREQFRGSRNSQRRALGLKVTEWAKAYGLESSLPR